MPQNLYAAVLASPAAGQDLAAVISNNSEKTTNLR
jgi:hypothetical protein